MSNNPEKSPKGNILVVDDRPDNLRLLSSMLSEQGYKIRKAISGEMALMACRTTQPDLVLLDIDMPDMDGYQVCQQLKASSETCDIPVIFISALDNVWDKLKAFQVGGVDYITKPFHFEEVVARVENQLTIQRLKFTLQEKNRLLEERNDRLISEVKKRRLAETALQQANKQLEYLAGSDGLTEVANRRHFNEYLQREWQRSAREKISLSLIMCDIDYFKNYNDNYGHLAGDDCLKQVAKAISSAIKRPADLVARYGGEEFAALLPNTNLQGAVQVAQRIQQEVQRLQIAHAFSIVSDRITLSLGVASLVPNLKKSSAVLIDESDKALYEAKKLGRNQYLTFNN